ncbi:hypothetical protein [Shinella sp. M31]|uniref:hypothetical protein n=1 Tax=Shinella sp. M31 TaxID=3368615 RepID=UPI003B9E24AC
MVSPLKISARVEIDASQAKQGAASSVSAVDTIGAAAERNTTKVQALVNASVGLNSGAANQNAREWTGALAMQGKSLDELRAKYNPLFATISQYKAAQTEIRTLHAQGVLSTDEMVAALQRHRQAALVSIDAIKGRSAAMAEEAAAAAALAERTDQLRSRFDPLFAAGERYRKALADIADAERLGAVSASEAIDVRQRATVAYNAEINSLERLATARKTAAQAIVDRNTITPDRGRDIAAYGTALDGLRAKYNPLYAVITHYKAAQAEIRQAHAVGAISADEMTAALQRQRQATMGTIDAIKGRSRLGEGYDREGGFRRQNLGYQLFDIGQGGLSGMPLGLIAAQQLPQVAQLYAGEGGGIKALLADVGNLATGAVTAIGAMPLALAAAGTAAILYDRNVNSAAARAEAALEKHEEALQRIKALFDQSGSGAERYGQRAQNAISFAARTDRRNLEEALAAQTKAAGTQLLNAAPRGSGAAMTNLYGPYLPAVNKFIAEARQGKGDIQALNDEIDRIANANEADDRIQKIAERLHETTGEAMKTLSAIKELNGEVARTTLDTTRTAAVTSMAGWRIENADALAAVRKMSAAELAGIGARSPTELAEAARTRVAAEPFDPRVSDEVRYARENAAATLARAQAEKSLSDAAEQRNRQLDNSIESQKLELSLIGQTVGEQERLRMAFRLTSELQAEAARNNTNVSAGELARVQALSAEYGRLAEQMVARRALDEQDQEIAALRVRLALTGQSEDVRARAIRHLETERQRREMGLSLGSREAEQYRQKEELIGRQNEQLRKQEAAWDKVRGTAENSIDTVVDKFSEGDWSGGLEDIAKDWKKNLLQLGVANPIKNMSLGTNHETLDDIGGIGGMFSKLFGGGMSTGTMSVTAATVSVNGGVAGLPGLTDLKAAAANDNSNAIPLTGGAGNPLGFVGNYKSGVDPRLTDILQKASQSFPGYKVDAMSGFRPGDPRFHGKGLATDVQLTDLASGKLLGNYQDAATFGTYERFAQTARAVQMRDYPELADKFRWGGYFGGGKGKYGAVDNMHFDLGGAGMAGGSWEGGLTSAQRALWPGIESKGNAAVAALDKVAKTSSLASEGLGVMGTGMGEFGKDLTNFFPAAPGGGSTPGGGGGFLGSLFGMLFSPQYRIAAGGGIGLYAKGGIADRASIFGEAGPEAAVPLPDGRSIPVTLNVRQAYQRPQQSMGSGGAGMKFVIENRGSTPVKGEVQEETDSHGRRQYRAILDDAVSAELARPGSSSGRTLRAMGMPSFGARR